MDTALFIVLFMLLVCFASNANAIQCYYCSGSCSNPFNKTDSSVTIQDSPTGWCLKAKISKGRRSAIIRSPDTLGLCSENGCKSVLYKGFEEADCCCNTDLSESCQTPGFPVFCENCTSFFCANHVKGCQGTPCKAVCIPDSSSTTTTVSSSSSSMEPITTMMSSSSSMETITNTTASGGYFIRIELFVISASLTLLILFQLNL